MKYIVFFLASVVLVGAGCESPNSVVIGEDYKYKNQTYGFEFSYPKDYEFVTPTYTSLEDKIVQIQTPRDLYPNTNFSDAGVAVSAEFAKDLNECLGKNQGGKIFSQNMNINGEVFYFATSSDAGAGNFYESNTYRSLLGGQLCFEISETIHTTNIGNYPPGTVKEVNKGDVINSLRNILSSFKFERNIEK